MRFDPKAYLEFNQDLKDMGMSSGQLKKHFEEIGFRERRIYAKTSGLSDFLSMKYLRGNGLEIGAGNSPLKLYGDAKCSYADIDDDSPYRVEKSISQAVLDISAWTEVKKRKDLCCSFDFVAASHVVEHCPSLVRTLKGLAFILKPNGILYLVVPNKSFDWDKDWIKDFSFIHHFVEAFLPNFFMKMHRKSFIRRFKMLDESAIYWASEFNNVRGDILSGQLGAKNMDYIYHKHSYDLSGWLRVFLALIKFFRIKLQLIEVASSSDRNDVHMIFIRK